MPYACVAVVRSLACRLRTAAGHCVDALSRRPRRRFGAAGLLLRPSRAASREKPPLGAGGGARTRADPRRVALGDGQRRLPRREHAECWPATGCGGSRSRWRRTGITRDLADTQASSRSITRASAPRSPYSKSSTKATLTCAGRWSVANYRGKRGRAMELRVNGDMLAGPHTIVWDATAPVPPPPE